MYRRILVPVDGSDTSTLGLQEAIRIAKNQSARIRLISVVDEFVVAQNVEGYLDAGNLLDTLRDSGKKIIADAVALTRRRSVKADSVLYETMGKSVADLIIREARKWKADLLVVGSHGREGISRMVLGSAVDDILRAATIPVLVVRSQGRRKRAAKK